MAAADGCSLPGGVSMGNDQPLRDGPEPGIADIVPLHRCGDSIEEIAAEQASLWRRIDAARFEFAMAASGRRHQVGWDEFRSAMVDAKTAEWNEELQALVVRRPVVGEEPLDAPAAYRARALLDRWLADRDRRFQVDALRWAIALGDWGAIDATWLDWFRADRVSVEAEIAGLLAGLPVEARRENPLLTWAWAVAASGDAPPAKREVRMVTNLVSDAIALHSQWQESETIDGAIAGGTVWMLAQRLMPTTPHTDGLEEAWRTHNEVARCAADRRRRGEPPSRSLEVVFRAASLRIALARADLPHAIAEADFAYAVDPVLASGLVSGGRNLATELLGVPGEIPPSAHQDEPLSFAIGLSAQDAMSCRLAKALAPLRRLDRDGCTEALQAFSGMPPGAPGWTAVIYLKELVGALWDDPEVALIRADSEVARHAVASIEQRGRVGTILLARGRATLLDRLGAHRAALAAGESLPASWGRAVMATALLWAGDPEGAHRVASAGLHDVETTPFDRVSLLVARAAATVMDASRSPTSRLEATTLALEACAGHDVWLPLGLIPPAARERMVDLVDGSGQASPVPPEILERLGALTRQPTPTSTGIVLTRRERVLLPLLATSDTVPEIAARLHVSVSTVRKQVVTLRSKFGAASRQELVRLARDASLL